MTLKGFVRFLPGRIWITPACERSSGPLEYELTVKLILLGILLLVSGFFSGSEAAIFFLTPLHLHKMREERFPFTASVERLLARPRNLLVTIIAGNESVNIAITALTTSVLIYLIGTEGKWVAIAAASIVLSVFCEAIPKTFGVTHPMKFSSAVALPFVVLTGLLRPVVWSLEKISDLFVALFGKSHRIEGKTLTEDEFKALVDAGHQEGALEAAQKDLIHRVFELADTKVSDIMVPRVDMFCLPISMNIREVEREIIRTREGRIPIYGTDRDDILGILHSKHLLAVITGRDKRAKWQRLIKKPYFVPMEKRADEMLREFQSRRLQIAIVVDEYGGVAGLVTLDDILKTLFADIYEEHGDTRNRFNRIGEDTIVVSGMMEIEEFSRLVKIPIATEEFDTAGGFVFHLFGKLPAEEEEVSVEGYTFTVEKIDKARILSIRITKRGDSGDA
jgi:CBS domain containing-hemolysin-like protein